ncbi:hypothetical protein [Serratia fonticola]
MSIKKCLVVLTAATIPFLTNAETLTNQKDVTTNVTFYQPNEFSHTLRAETNLIAGQIPLSAVVAKGTVKTLGATTGQYALQFPSTSEQSGGVSSEIQGKNNSENMLSVSLEPLGVSYRLSNINGSNWYAMNPIATLNYEVRAMGNAVADVYPVTVSAAVYSN